MLLLDEPSPGLDVKEAQHLAHSSPASSTIAA
jgi:ABC-type Mn2+/Zn2+ transport system ATPase subunit